MNSGLTESDKADMEPVEESLPYCVVQAAKDLGISLDDVRAVDQRVIEEMPRLTSEERREYLRSIFPRTAPTVDTAPEPRLCGLEAYDRYHGF